MRRLAWSISFFFGYAMAYLQFGAGVPGWQILLGLLAFAGFIAASEDLIKSFLAWRIERRWKKRRKRVDR